MYITNEIEIVLVYISYLSEELNINKQLDFNPNPISKYLTIS